MNTTTTTTTTADDLPTFLSNKLWHGNEITSLDLEALQASSKENIPFLDRSYLQNSSNTNHHPYPLVRMIGMVHDMHPDQVYVTHDIHGHPHKYKHTHHHNDSDDDCFGGGRLAMRTPLIMVPVPFTTPTAPSTTTSSTPSTASSTKRSSSTRMTMEDERSVKPRMEDASSACKDNSLPELDDASSYSSTTTASPPKSTTHNSTIMTERWPAGCLSSNPLETPVLAHLYYDNDHDDSNDKLKLNQIVELVGVLSTSTPSQTSTEDHSSSPTSKMNDPSSSSMQLLDEYDPVWNDHNEEEQEHLPTLNVLVHRVLTMEEYGEQQLQTKNHKDDSFEPEQDCRMELPSHDDDELLQTLSEALLGSNLNHNDVNETAAHALWWTLLSKAEPQNHNHNDSPAVGCASLNLIVKDGSSSTALWQRLTQLCRHVCPVVASLDVTRAALETHQLICTPGKNNNHNRMQASPLQLPDGAIVLLHLGNLQPGVLSPTAQATLQALQQLTSHHTVDYVYDPWTTLPMRTNVRVICVATPASQRLLPCTLNVTLNTTRGMSTMEYNPHKQLTALRQHLAQARAPTSIGLSHEVVQAVQDEFCQRRQNDNMNNTINSEQLLHVWMNGLRLEARRQLQTQATVHHLQRVLQVVDQIY